KAAGNDCFSKPPKLPTKMASISLNGTPACSTASRPARAMRLSSVSPSSLPNFVCAQPMIAVIPGTPQFFRASYSTQIPFKIACGRLSVEPVGLDLLHRAEGVDECLAEIFLEDRGAREGIDRVVPVAGNVSGTA